MIFMIKSSVACRQHFYGMIVEFGSNFSVASIDVAYVWKNVLFDVIPASSEEPLSILCPYESSLM